jgi:hypothetical protein
MAVLKGHESRLDDALNKEKFKSLETLVSFWQKYVLGEAEVDRDGSWQLVYHENGSK